MRIRYCTDIGLWSVDRPRSSCRHASPFCARHCYNASLYRAFGHTMAPSDSLSEVSWLSLSPATVSAMFDRLERSPRFRRSRRLRLMTRGEALSTLSDLPRVRYFLDGARAHKTLVWLPTRAWRSSTLRPYAERLQANYPDTLRLLASTDPSDPIAPPGWSTMFFGDNDATSGRILCPKTWKTHANTCATCRGRCFSPRTVRGETHIHLKQH